MRDITYEEHIQMENTKAERRVSGMDKAMEAELEIRSALLRRIELLEKALQYYADDDNWIEKESACGRFKLKACTAINGPYVAKRALHPEGKK